MSSFKYALVLPAMLYGCETWCHLTNTELHKLEVFQHYALKLIQNLPVRTRSDMVESLMGVYRIKAEIDKRKLLFLQTLISMPETFTCKKIFLRRLFHYILTDDNSQHVQQSGFIPDIFNIIYKYSLGQYIENYIRFSFFPAKREWNRIVKQSVLEYENNALNERLSLDSDFNLFRTIKNSYSEPYVLWKYAKSRTQLSAAYYVVKMLTCPPQQNQTTCDKCGGVKTDTVLHLATQCSVTNNERDKFTNIVLNDFGVEMYLTIDSLNNHELLQILFGKNIVHLAEKDIEQDFIHVCACYLRIAANKYFSPTSER